MTDTNKQQLVSINPKQASSAEARDGLSRRSFLKVLGAASAAGVAGCADSAKQKVFPYNKGQENQIPGVAVWYRSTCTECTAGCGISVRTREGRIVKVEGSPDNPINRGGLCALGQASLQALYDPDRVRQPLRNTAAPGEKPKYEPISWDKAYQQIADFMKQNSDLENVFFTGNTTGTIDKLTKSFCEQTNTTQVVHDITQPTDLARASELVYGHYGVPRFRFDKAEMILSLGADFLETWISPVEYARDWASTRRKKHPGKLIHVEPRLSLTAANADSWIKSNPGTEHLLALALLKNLVESGKGKNLSEDVRNQLGKMVKNINLTEVASETGVSKQKILLMAESLRDARSSLVVAGGTAASSGNSLTLMVATSFLNLVLANVGKTVDLSSMRSPRGSIEDAASAIDKMNDGKVGVVFVHGTNPEFTLPDDFNFRYARRQGKARLNVSFNSHLDETTAEADLILPSNHSLEDWGDVHARSGVYGLVQPAMTPVFDTRGIGDMLLELASKAGKDISEGSANFKDYLQNAWKEVHASSGDSGSFEGWWRESVEKGGYFAPASGERKKVDVAADAFKVDLKSATLEKKGASASDLIVYPYLSVKTFDGRAANRAWMQEIPDPVTKAVWDSWVEIHPDTAKEKGISKGDFITVRNHFGEVNAPAYLTTHVGRGMVAIPVGQGHTGYGRFAMEVENCGNVLNLISKNSNQKSGNLALVSSRAKVLRGRGKADLVITQGSDSQHGRELARTKKVAASAAAAHAGSHSDSHAHGGDHGHGGHHEPRQMYEQREHPLYKWGMAVDLAACTGCSACVVACYAENNIATVGKEIAGQGREMAWLRIERYYEGEGDDLQVNFMPMMCQQCNNAPCEPVCPVYATYHNEEGLNVMVYNRCVGTRYCANNCSYKVRAYNWFQYEWPEPLNLQLNPDVVKRTAGVMEKCSFCVQRITEAKDRAKDLGRPVQDGEVQPACVQSCPTQALSFGNLNDPESEVSKRAKQSDAYKVLDHHLNTQPSVTYIEDIKYEI